jgi:peptidoglycan hydrolase CwlO-like protein
MADKGPGPQDLVRKRITTEIMRLEFTIVSQELEIMETQERIERLKANIDASRQEIVNQQENLTALDEGKE